MPESGEQDRDSKTEEATPYRREEVRKKGNVAQSREIGTAMLLLSAAVLFYFYGSNFFNQLIKMVRSFFMRIENFQLTDGNAVVLLIEILKIVASLLMPIFIICMVIGFLSNVLQTGFIFTSETMKFNLNKINPVAGFKRLFSMRSGIEAIKAIFKLIIITSVVYMVIKGEIIKSVLLIDQDIMDIVRFLGLSIFKTVLYVAFLMIILAVLDFLYQKIKHEKDIRMSKQEVKEELKEREGDPNIKARVRSLQRQIATKRMMQKVPEAQVVITNPTHIAIALQYSKDSGAPKVIAKGADYLAEKIRNIARENDIPMVENKPLAWELYKQVKIGQFIPENLYNAVAEVLVYVMKIKNHYANVFMDGDEVNRFQQGLNV